MQTVKLRSRLGSIVVEISAPNGKKFKFNFNEGNNFTLEVPTVMEHINTMGKSVVFQTNFAQHLLDSAIDNNPNSKTYGEHKFELVSIVENPVVVEPKTIKKSKKEEKNDETTN